MTLQMFNLKSSNYQNPAFARPNGQTKIQGMFRLIPTNTTTNAERESILVLDVSGSMGTGGALAALKLAVKAYLEQVPDGDKVGILTFSSRSDITWLQHSTTLNDSNRQQMIRKVQGLSPRYTTCYGTSLQKAVDVLNSSSADIRRIEFFTDGESYEDGTHVPGKGFMSDEEHALWVVEQAAEAGIEFVGYGMGENYNAQYMQQWTTAANANFYHITANGDGLDHMMAQNAMRFGKGVAGNVTVEIRMLNGFTFGLEPNDPEQKPWIFRTAPQKHRLTPIMGGTLVVDDIGTVNAVEGIPYEFIAEGTVDISTDDTWEVDVAEMTVRFKVGGQEHEQVVMLTQAFTTDFGAVRSDQSVANTMTATRIEVTTAETLQAYSIARTMGDTAEMQRLSMVMTMAGEQAGKNNLLRLSMSIDDAVQGLGDDDKTRAAGTMFMSVDMDDVLGGMGDD